MKKLALPLVFLLLLAGVAIWLWQGKQGKTATNNIEFAVQDTAAITRIFLADKGGRTIKLDRTSSGWMLNDKYAARPEAVNNMLGLFKLLAIKMPVPKSAYETVIKNMATTSVKVEIYQGDDTPTKVFHVGSPYKEHTGTYMLLDGSDRPYVMHKKGLIGYLNPYFSTTESEWRNNELFRFAQGDISAVAVEHPHEPAQSFEVQHLGNNTFQVIDLANNRPLAAFDTARAIDFIARFHKVPFEGIEETHWKEKRDSVTATLPQQVYTVTNAAGERFTASTWLKPISRQAHDLVGDSIAFDIERMVAVTPEDDYVVVQYPVFDLLSRKLDYFRAR